MPDSGFSQLLRRRKEISITVKGRRSGRAITLPVWFVLEGATLWLLPVRGSHTQWFRNLLVDPTITIRAGRQRRTGTAHPITDRGAIQQVTRKFRAKYTPTEIARYYSGLNAAVQVPL